MTITVNGVEITENAIARETQYHPAETLAEAREEATRALVIKELLLQRARAVGLAAADVREDDDTRTDEEVVVDALLDREIVTPEPDEATCRRYYENNKAKFMSPRAYRCAHILLEADPEDGDALAAAETRARELIGRLQAAPELFGQLAEGHSACPSRESGGELGLVPRQSVVREFTEHLDAMTAPGIYPEPVRTRFGVHVLRLDEVQPPQQLDFEQAADKIARYLSESSWRQAANQYVMQLIGASEITGIALDGAESPLVQ